MKASEVIYIQICSNHYPWDRMVPGWERMIFFLLWLFVTGDSVGTMVTGYNIWKLLLFISNRLVELENLLLERNLITDLIYIFFESLISFQVKLLFYQVSVCLIYLFFLNLIQKFITEQIHLCMFGTYMELLHDHKGYTLILF